MVKDPREEVSCVTCINITIRRVIFHQNINLKRTEFVTSLVAEQIGELPGSLIAKRSPAWVDAAC